MNRIPPQSIEAEESVLGSMLLDKSAITEAVQILKPEDFFHPQYQQIYELIIDLYNNNKPVDIVTVSNKGIDIEMLVFLANNITTTANIKHHAGILKGKSIRRKFIKSAQEVIEMAYDGEFDNIVDFKNEVMAKVDIDVKDSSKKDPSIMEISNRFLSNLEKRYKDTNIHKMTYGFDWLDRKTGGAYKGEMTVVGARPSIGKTALSLQVGKNLAVKGNSVAIFNLEMTDESLVSRMLTSTVNINSQKLRNPKLLNDNDWIIISDGYSDLTDLQINIYDDIYRIEEIRAKCRELKIKNKLDFVIIDYLGLCETIKKFASTNDRVSYISRQTKLMAKELNVPVWILAQLNRSNEHDNRRPKLIDLRDSGAIEQDADNVFFLHDENYGKYTDQEPPEKTPIELIIAKQRNGDRDVSHDIYFYKKTQRFYDN